MSATGSTLAVDHRLVRGVTVVAPTGVLDVATYPLMRDALLEQATEQPRGIVADLDGLRVVHSSPLSVFPTVGMKLTDWPGIPLLLACAREPLATTLRASAVPRFVPTHLTVAAAVAAVTDPPPRRRATLDLTGRPPDASRVRAWLADVGVRWGLGAIDDAVLVTSELVENMIRHAPRRGWLRVELRGSDLVVAVPDGDPAPPLLIAPQAATRNGGRGVAMVDALARVWGHSPCPTGGKIVWAVIPLDRPELPPTN